MLLVTHIMISNIPRSSNWFFTLKLDLVRQLLKNDLDPSFPIMEKTTTAPKADQIFVVMRYVLIIWTLMRTVSACSHASEAIMRIREPRV